MLKGMALYNINSQFVALRGPGYALIKVKFCREENSYRCSLARHISVKGFDYGKGKAVPYSLEEFMRDARLPLASH